MMFGLKDRALAMIGGGTSILLLAALAYVMITGNARLSEVRSQLNATQAELRAARDDLTQCRANRITLEDATRRQNEAVAAATSSMAARLEVVEGVAATAASEAAKARKGADRILATQGSGDVCRDADALIMGEVK